MGFDLGQVIRGIDSGFNDWVDKTDFIEGYSNKGGVRTTDNGANWGKTLNNAAPTNPYFDPNNYAQPQQATQNGGDTTPIYNGSAASAAGGGGAATSDPATASYYQDMMNQLNTQNGRLDGTLNTGLSNLQNSYNTQSNRLNDQIGVAQRNFNDQTQQNMQGYTNTRNGIMQNTRQTSNALQRLLGLNGAGNSSAALEQAPYAAGLQGSQNINEAQQNYSNNTTSLKNKWDDTNTQFNNSRADLDNQKYTQENSLRSSIAQTRAGILEKLSQASVNKEMASGKNYDQARAARTPFQSQIDSLLDQMTGLGNQYANPVMKTADVSFQAPELGQFSLGSQAQIANQGGAQGALDPTFLSLLTQRDKDRNTNPLG